MLKKSLPQLIFFGVICIIAAFCYVKSEFIDVNTAADTTYTVIIDAGHGGLTNTMD